MTGVMYIGQADRRTVTSEDLPEELRHEDPDSEGWVADWVPGEEVEFEDEVAQWLVRNMKSEFRLVPNLEPEPDAFHQMNKTQLRAEMKDRGLGSRNMGDEEMRHAIRSHDASILSSSETAEEA